MFSDSLHDRLRAALPRLRATWWLIAANLAIFAAMLLNGAGLWHSPNGVQLAWGANFGPATQDGEWWRLVTAMFLHFGVVHLGLNMWALWDGGQWVERMFGSRRFVLIYFAAGLAGNLLSLVTHVGRAVSGGASGAIFGIYGALLGYLWLERDNIQVREFRWLFWGALGFSGATIFFGLIVPGIDNSAHIGGFVTGALMAGCLHATPGGGKRRWLSVLALSGALGVLIMKIPPPAYRWGDEKRVRQEIGEFLRDDQAITKEWLNLMRDGEAGKLSFDQLAERIESGVTDRYEKSFEELSSLPQNHLLPSQPTLAQLREYAAQRRDASRDLAEGLRKRDKRKIRKALEDAGKAAR